MENLACPYCFKQITMSYSPECGRIKLFCERCDFSVKDKIPYYTLHRFDDSWSKCIGQVKAVRKAENSCASYQVPATEVQKQHSNRSVDMNEEMIKICLSKIGNVKAKVFLDLGGSTGWASLRFIKEGAFKGYLIDIDPKLLGSFDDNIISILGDGYNIPLIDNCLDFVFDCSALHHFEDKPAVLRQIKRVLKPGGIYVSQGNPPRMGENDDDRVRYMNDFGLIETMPTHKEYNDYFMEVFGNHEVIQIEDNTVMVAIK